MDSQLQFLQDNDEDIIDAEMVVLFGGEGSETGIKITLDDFCQVIILSKSDLERMLEYLNEE